MLKPKPTSAVFLLAVMILFTSIMVGPLSTLAAEDDIEISDLETQKNRIVLASSDFEIEVNAGGTVPFYHFNTTLEQARFFLKLQRIVQYKDGNGNQHFDEGELVGGDRSTLQLSSVDWDFELITDSASTVEFAFTSSEVRNQAFSGVDIELVNHFTAGSTALKFDVNITNWPFDPEATGLSFEYEVSWALTNGDSDPSSQLIKESTDTGIYLKNADDQTVAYFASVSEIIVDDVVNATGASQHDTAVTNAPKLNIYINYPRFISSLIHDPEFGTSAAAIIPLTDPTAIILWFQENVKAGFLGVTGITTFVLVALLMVNRRKR